MTCPKTATRTKKAQKLLVISVLFAMTALSSCSGTQRTQGKTSPVGYSIPAADVVISQWPAPMTLGTFDFSGEIENPVTQTRILHYIHWDYPDCKLDISLYPVPGGWADMSKERLVAGHYGQIRQAVVHRALNRGANEVSIEEETIGYPDSPRSADQYPIARGIVQQRHGDTWTATEVTLTVVPPLLLSTGSSIAADRLDLCLPALQVALSDYLSRLATFSPTDAASGHPQSPEEPEEPEAATTTREDPES